MCEQRQPVFCGVKMQFEEPFCWGYRWITVKCGNTNWSGDLYQCEKCQSKNAGISWRKLVGENGDQFEEVC